MANHKPGFIQETDVGASGVNAISRRRLTYQKGSKAAAKESKGLSQFPNRPGLTTDSNTCRSNPPKSQ